MYFIIPAATTDTIAPVTGIDKILSGTTRVIAVRFLSKNGVSTCAANNVVASIFTKQPITTSAAIDKVIPALAIQGLAELATVHAKQLVSFVAPFERTDRILGAIIDNGLAI
ncbi:hypothetical protein WP8S17C03_26030 [Metapseudomonas otitidis]|uniref:Uncharacterized protein n=1 Tax=Metapseudomonas otitidis TaxID=319939 RepID=A0A6S5RTZ6_9GAMM|nr:hypothetical protein WP8S17C03_26030 [Pseudomonas otitidis]